MQRDNDGTDARAIDTGSDSSEVSFALRFVDGSERVLERCAQPEQEAEMLDMLEAAVGEDGAGGAVAVLRHVKTQLVFGGSRPVQWDKTLVARSAAPTVFPIVYGFWPHTYVAGHHNWLEESTIELRRDVTQWHTSFADNATRQEGLALRRVLFSDLNGIDPASDNPRVSLVLEDLASGARTTESFSADRFWRPVGASALLASWSSECEDAAVLTLGTIGSDAHVLQALVCPREVSPGFEVRRVVPVMFMDDLARVGEAFDAADEVDVEGRRGWLFAVGRYDVTVSGSDVAFMRMAVVDRESGVPVNVSLPAMTVTDDLPDEQAPQSFTYASADGTVTFSLSRRFVAVGVGESAIYVPLVGALTFVDETAPLDIVATGLDQLRYTNTHHNWDDTLEVLVDDLVVRWSVEYRVEPAEGLVYHVSAARDDVELIAPTSVFPQ